MPTDQIIDTFWTGGVDASRELPATVPRPRLLRWHEWHCDGWTYRAELYERLSTQPISPTAVLNAEADIPSHWWSALRAAIDNIGATSTRRITVEPGYLAWVMPRHLGRPLPTAPSGPWVTAHGDLHYANLCGPALAILDWEGWGLAPAGYDAATLHAHSLAVPAAAARVRHELADHLATASGTYAELVVISELLDGARHGHHTDLVQPLHRRAARLLGREPPG
jgi:hypothetical protein